MINQMERERLSSTSAATSAAEELDEEEAKMEKFYELIRRFNEARAYHLHNQVEDYDSQEQININHNHNRNCCNGNINGPKFDNNNNNIKKTTSNLIPSFKWEDFRDVFGNREEEDHHHHQQVDVSDKSGNELHLQPSSNFDKSCKKRKINELIDGNNNDYDNDNDNGDAVDRLKNTRPQLDLNLAL